MQFKVSGYIVINTSEPLIVEAETRSEACDKLRTYLLKHYKREDIFDPTDRAIVYTNISNCTYLPEERDPMQALLGPPEPYFYPEGEEDDEPIWDDEDEDDPEEDDYDF